MKCPHCGQEHPDNYKFCPNTAKLLLCHFKACTNELCVDFGKYVLPLNSKFCPTCGFKIEDESCLEDDNEDNVNQELSSNDDFLHIHGIVIGYSNSYDLEAMGYEKISNKKGFLVNGCNFLIGYQKVIESCVFDSENNAEIPDHIPLCFYMSLDKVEEVLESYGFITSGFGEGYDSVVNIKCQYDEWDCLIKFSIEQR